MEVEVNGIYKHFKGDYYIVEDIALDCETLEKMVIYRALYEDGKLWVRSYKSFIEEVNKNDQKYKFELVRVKSKRQN